MGNLGVSTISENETWVTVGEGMYRANEITEGADGSVYCGRLLWDRPKELASGDSGRRVP